MRNIACSAIEKALAAVVILFVGGCTTVAQVTSLSDQNCLHTFVDRMSSILFEQGEKASPSGADYGFFVEQKSSDCLLRLFSWQKGFTRYRNNLTYIATRSLTGCMCVE